MDNHRQNIRKEFPVKEYQIIRNPDDFFSDLDKVYKYYDGGRYYNDYYYILKNRNFEKEKIIIYFKFNSLARFCALVLSWDVVFTLVVTIMFFIYY